MISPVYCRCPLHSEEEAQQRGLDTLVGSANRVREIMALTPPYPNIGQMIAEGMHILSNCACHPRGVIPSPGIAS